MSRSSGLKPQNIPMLNPMKSLNPVIAATLLAGLCFNPLAPIMRAAGAGALQQTASHIIVFGVDGLSPDGIEKAATPNMHRLMKEGSYSLHARAVMPTSSSPNWASMIMGAGPEQHGVTSNDWETNRFEIAPTAIGPGGIFPTIFSVIREQHPKSVTGSFYDWDGFGRLTERSLIDADERCEGPTNTVSRAVSFLKEKRPEFLFLQLDHVDHAGHEYGHGTAEYYASVEVADKLLGQLLDALEEQNFTATTTILVTSDHGGVKKGHGKATMPEIEIPWILAGPGVVKGRELSVPISTYDTAATAAWMLNLKTPSSWIAKPVLEAFESQPSR